MQGEKDALQRILYNLLSNVMHYGSDGNYLGIFIREDKRNVYIDKELMRNDIEIVSMYQHTESLEDYFFKMTEEVQNHVKANQA